MFAGKWNKRGAFETLTDSNIADSHIQSLPLEASWAAKYAGLSERAAIDLVSRNIEKIMGIDAKEESRDIVVFEGNPLEYGASVVLSLDGDEKSVMDCWPEAE